MRLQELTQHCLKTKEELELIIENIRSSYPTSRIVFTNGCFDILHPAHIYTIQKASEYKGLMGILIVALNSDNSVRRFKGSDRPIQNQLTRAIVISSLKGVDYVTIFEEDNPLALIDAFKPDFLIKGGAPIEERVREEKKLVESYGGTLVCLPEIPDLSTTDYFEKIKKIGYQEGLTESRI